MSLQEELDRCDRELLGIPTEYPDAPAWLQALGRNDWEVEKRLIREEKKP